MAKRLFDILVAGLGTLLLLPVFLAIAAAIKLDSPGPVMFRQARVGRRGRIFRIHKFRTMISDAEQHGPPITIGVDPRVTRTGAWLRRHKLDELPQPLDVLAGAMSLVGPRPEVPRYVELYPADVRDMVLSVRPGITDPASVEHFDESALLAAYPDPERAYQELILPRKLALCVDYVTTRSMLGDLRIITKTLASLWRR